MAALGLVKFGADVCPVEGEAVAVEALHCRKRKAVEPPSLLPALLQKGRAYAGFRSATSGPAYACPSCERIGHTCKTPSSGRWLVRILQGRSGAEAPGLALSRTKHDSHT